eukprot:CAMPEP_0202867802 /NCGR_PEP_ID=MMETSP1391-20130828/9630_1 /ASSEMBLY_ACC=CAM_ASM_000867 /TAXON_ID=1034604 /ORGANISM="Chlamydomonas leiostraca, Strain SAG 11-49" /LENGTH=269 /DNA_ID=CAMNT_0049547871 /DNA_START=63 /DNA_END=868 /DNA_ORIENTATION=-
MASDYLKYVYPAPLIDDGVPRATDLLQTLWVAVVLIIVRFLADHTVLPLLKWFLGKYKRADKASNFFDNMYIVVWSLGTEVLAIYVTLHKNGGCKPWATDACLTGWPNHPTNLLQRWYMILMFQFYLHEMVGSCIGVGTPLKSDMVIHHIATMGLVSGAYIINVNRYGIMWQALFDTSNPLLHIAKGLHALDLPQLEGTKWAAFASFAACFFVCRVAAAPFSIIYPAVTRSLGVLPRNWALSLMALMAVVCGIQWVWFKRILEMAAGEG